MLLTCGRGAGAQGGCEAPCLGGQLLHAGFIDNEGGCLLQQRAAQGCGCSAVWRPRASPCTLWCGPNVAVGTTCAGQSHWPGAASLLPGSALGTRYACYVSAAGSPDYAQPGHAGHVKEMNSPWDFYM